VRGPDRLGARLHRAGDAADSAGDASVVVFALHAAEQAALSEARGLAPCLHSLRKVDGWQTLAIKPIAQPIDLAA
jgi:hypothetical protein